MPRTTIGRWAAGLLVLSVALLLWLLIGGVAGGTASGIAIGTTWMVSALTTAVLALLARVKHGDRSLTVLVAIVIGLLFSVMTLLEFLQLLVE